MLKDVTLGQYFPGETSVHKLDPRTKLVLVIVYIVALFLAKGAASYALVAACLLAVIGISKIHLKVIVKSLKPLLLIIILTAVLNLFYGSGEPLVQFWIFKITKQGIENAVDSGGLNGKETQPAGEGGDQQRNDAAVSPQHIGQAVLLLGQGQTRQSTGGFGQKKVQNASHSHQPNGPQAVRENGFHLVAIGQAEDAQENHEADVDGEQALVEAQGDHQHRDGKQLPPAALLPEEYGAHRCQYRKHIGIQVGQVGGGKGGRGQVDGENAAGEDQQPALPDVKDPGRNPHGQGNPDQGQHSAIPGSDGFTPEQQLVHRRQETAQGNFPLGHRPGVVAHGMKDPEFVQGIVGDGEIQQGIAMGGQTPEKCGEKNGGETVFLPVKPGQQGSGHG